MALILALVLALVLKFSGANFRANFGANSGANFRANFEIPKKRYELNTKNPTRQPLGSGLVFDAQLSLWQIQLPCTICLLYIFHGEVLISLCFHICDNVPFNH